MTDRWKGREETREAVAEERGGGRKEGRELPNPNYGFISHQLSRTLRWRGTNQLPGKGGDEKGLRRPHRT